MKKTVQLAIIAATVLGLASPVLATEYTRGEVTKIDAKQKKLTIRHEELKNLEMPAMTMVFVVAEDSMLEKVTVGQTIDFVAERINGRITVTEVK